jgi:hypothetical protein
MRYGLDENNEFYVEYTACDRPVGNMREEMEKACWRLSSEGFICISLSSGLDSQVLLHTFHQMNLQYKCAFMYHPGYNESELKNIRVLEDKYKFKCQIIEIDPDKYREEVEALAIQTGIPAEHHLTKKFVSQIDPRYDILQGVESFDFIFRGKQTYCMESWTSIEIASQRAINELDREGRAVCIDRRAPFNEFALSMLSDDVVTGYCNSIRYIAGNGLVHKDTHEQPPLIFSWEYYVKPILYGKYWGKELELFPKDIAAKNIDWIMNPTDPRLRHNYKNKCTYIERDELINHLSQWGTKKVLRKEQYKVKNEQ